MAQETDSISPIDKQVAFLQSADHFVKAGALAQARVVLSKFQERFPLPALKRETRLELANLYRRVDRPLKALRILNSLFGNDGAIDLPPTADEICSYAASLISIGVQEEALAMLKPLVKQGHPVALLQRSFFHMQRWEYHRSFYFLKRYVRLKGLSRYQILVGKINLASCLIVLENFVRAGVLLEQVLSELNREQHRHILKQVFRLQAQIEIENMNYDKARNLLLKTLADSESDFIERSDRIVSVAELITHKWLVVIDLKINNDKARALGKMHEIQAHAQQLKSWETVRDCAFHLATHSGDMTQLLGLYRQTPYLSFRKKILKSLDAQKKVEFELCLQNENLDLGSPSVGSRNKKWARDRSRSERLLEFLRSDSFRPFHIGEVFSVLYPDERFDSHNSPIRVAKAVQRLNQFLQNSGKLKIKVKSVDRQFKIVCVESDGGENSVDQKMELGLDRMGSGINTQLRIEKLRIDFKGRTFTQKKISVELGVSKAESQKLIRLLLERKQIRKTGSKKDGIYIFNNFRSRLEK